MTFLTIFNQVAILFGLIVVGYIVRKLKILNNELNRGISKLVLQVTLPALIIKSMQFSFSREVMLGSIQIILLSLLAHGVAIGISFLYTRLLGYKGSKADVYRFMLIFSNVGYMGYPIIKVIYGDLGVFYTALFNIPFNILLWTLGVYIMSNNSSKKTKDINYIKILTNPGIIAVFVGFTLFLLSVKLDYIVFETLNLLGETTVPLSMLIIGSMLAEVPIREVFNDIGLVAISFIRLIIIPLAVGLVIYSIGVRGMLLGVPIFISAMPAAANTAIFATIYDAEPHLASKGVFITTLLSMITIPLFTLLI